MVRRILWTDEMHEQLRELWHDTKLSNTAISLRMGVSMENLRNEGARMGFVPRGKLRGTPPYCFPQSDAPPPPQPLALGAHTLPPRPCVLAAMKKE
jgi:hypothetical protein